MKENWNKLKKTAEGFGSELDTHAAWERFEEKKKKKRGFVFFLPKIIGAFMVVSLMFYVSMHLTPSREIADNKKPNAKENISSTEHIKPTYLEEPDVSSKQSGGLDSNNKKNLRTEKKEKKAPEKILTKQNTETNQAVAQQIYSNNQDNHERTEFIKVQSVEKEPKENKIYYYNHTSQSSKTTTTAQTNKDQKEENKTIGKKELAQKINSLFSIAVLDLRQFTETREKEKCTLIKSNFPKIDAKKEKPQWAIDEWQLMIGYGVARRKLSGGQAAFTQRRTEGEDFINHMSLQLKASTELTHNFSLEYGLGINRYQSRIIDVTQELDPSFLFSDVLIEEKTQDGITSQIFGDIVGSQTIITERTRYQQYFDLDAIIQLGYTLSITDRFKAKVVSGFAYRFLGFNHGSSHASEFSFAEYASLSDLGYKTGNLWKANSDLQLIYALSNQLKLALGINSQLDLNNRIKSGFNSRDRFSSLNLMIGVTRKF